MQLFPPELRQPGGRPGEALGCLAWQERARPPRAPDESRKEKSCFGDGKAVPGENALIWRKKTDFDEKKQKKKQKWRNASRSGGKKLKSMETKWKKTEKNRSGGKKLKWREKNRNRWKKTNK